VALGKRVVAQIKREYSPNNSIRWTAHFLFHKMEKSLVGCPTRLDSDTEKTCSKPQANSLLQQRLSPRITTNLSLRDISMEHNEVKFKGDFLGTQRNF
jgi:hypothetical protein